MRRRFAAGSWEEAWADMSWQVGVSDQADERKPEPPGHRGILVVSFGTSYNESRQAAIEAIEAAIGRAYPQYKVRRAFTSQVIIDKVRQRDGVGIDNVEEALKRAGAEGITDLVVQPTHLLDGYEYMDLADAVNGFKGRFDRVVLGKPLLTSDEDFDKVVKAVRARTAAYDDGKTAICFMGHGTGAKSNKVYPDFQHKLKACGYENYYIGTVEAKPDLYDVVAMLREKGPYKKVVLEPLMVVAGDHANKDMAGDQEDSWKSVLKREGYEVECILEGLGQIAAVRDIYVDHIKAVIGSGYGEAGKQCQK